MNTEITKITNELYIVNGKPMMLEDFKWRPQIESLTSTEEKEFKLFLNTELFNRINHLEKNKA